MFQLKKIKRKACGKHKNNTASKLIRCVRQQSCLMAEKPHEKYICHISKSKLNEYFVKKYVKVEGHDQTFCWTFPFSV